jgi:hypothetical protein
MKRLALVAIRFHLIESASRKQARATFSSAPRMAERS